MLIEDGRIREIRPSAQLSDAGDAEVIDLAGDCLMPGLWDVHIHPDYLSLADVPLANQVTLFGNRLMTALTESGIVGLRCAGSHHFMDVAWKRAFDGGLDNPDYGDALDIMADELPVFWACGVTP